MGQSLVKNYIHIIFSTKHRQPIILPEYENELHSYLGGTCKNLDCQPIKVGGYTDHIHILCMLSKKIALMKLLEELKSHSSKWMKTKDELLKNFYWQDGTEHSLLTHRKWMQLLHILPTSMITTAKRPFRMNSGLF
jgi:putative transposase